MTYSANQTAVHARLQDILSLPPLPAIAQRLLALLSDDECDMHSLASLIEQDPGMAARIIGIANSAYFARPTPVCTISEAIVRVLGLNLVRGIAIGLALSKPFDLSTCSNFQLERFWYRAMQTATLAGRLAPASRLTDNEQSCLFLAGLLHNLGQLVLVHAFPDRMQRIFSEWAANPNLSLRSLQKEAFSLTESDAGSLVAQHWHLPDCIVTSIAFQATPLMAGEAAPMVRLVAYCAQLANQLYDDPEARPSPLQTAEIAITGLDTARLDALIDQIRAQDPALRALARDLAQAD